MAETTKKGHDKGHDPKPRNEPTEVNEIPRSPKGGGGSNPSMNPNKSEKDFRSGSGAQTGTGTTGGPRSGSEKVGTAATPRVGTTTGSSASTRSNTETRSTPRSEDDESGMPKRSGPGKRDQR